MENRVCKKCLLNKVFSDGEYKHMKEYIRSIDDYLKSDEAEYKRRLDICVNCDNLFNGMCRKCGCYVEIRAAIKNNYCPDVEKKW